jgi:hypothetical protein
LPVIGDDTTRCLRFGLPILEVIGPTAPGVLWRPDQQEKFDAFLD